MEKKQIVYEDFFMSNEQGDTASIALFAPDRAISLNSKSKSRPYETYSIEIRRNGYIAIRVDNVQIFADERSYLPVQLCKKQDSITKSYMYRIPEHLLFQANGGGKKQVSGHRLYDVMCNDPPAGVMVPDQLLVHLGASNQTGKQLCVPLLYYLKNITCSLIYPTWPIEALKANIWIELSFVMHRIQSSWYPKQGYLFDITSNINEDFLFVENRNLHQTICHAVEDVFHDFIQGIFFQKGYMYAHHCRLYKYIQQYDPWILFDISKKGYSINQIITALGNTMEIYTISDKHLPAIENSHEKQSDIMLVQKQLNKIASKYTSVSSLTETGYIDESSKRTIMDVQRLLGIPVNGELSENTRKLITQVYDELLNS